MENETNTKYRLMPVSYGEINYSRVTCRYCELKFISSCMEKSRGCIEKSRDCTGGYLLKINWLIQDAPCQNQNQNQTGD